MRICTKLKTNKQCCSVPVPQVQKILSMPSSCCLCEGNLFPRVKFRKCFVVLVMLIKVIFVSQDRNLEGCPALHNCLSQQREYIKMENWDWCKILSYLIWKVYQQCISQNLIVSKVSGGSWCHVRRFFMQTTWSFPVYISEPTSFFLLPVANQVWNVHVTVLPKPLWQPHRQEPAFNSGW